MFVNRAGSKGEQPVWSSAIVPPLVGFAHGGVTGYSQAPMAGYVKLLATMPAKSVVIPVPVAAIKVLLDGR